MLGFGTGLGFISKGRTYSVSLPTPGTPDAPIPAYLDALRTLYLNSSNLLAWIQGVEGTETTIGHVHLGRYPQTLKALVTYGPQVLIRHQNVRLDFSAPYTAVGQMDIVCDHVWDSGNEHTTADEFLDELGYVDKLINEMIGAIGVSLDADYGGSLASIDAPFSLFADPAEPGVMHCEVSYGIRIGKDGG